MPIHRYPGGVINADNVTPGANQASGVWTLESQLQANGAGNWPQSTSQMSRSLRFNSDDSAYLTRTFSFVGNRTTWTWSCWVKRSNLATGADQLIFRAVDGVANFNFALTTSNTVLVESGATTLFTSTPVYRDVSAWYHFILVFDSNNVTADNRCILYVNGVSQAKASGSVSSGTQLAVNTINPHFIGGSSSDRFLNGYMTEVVFVDGQALAPTAFGYTDSNNVWQPKPYAGSVGTNGFYLTFADNTSNLSTGIGKDYSNRGNNWTPVNFSVAPGAGNDSLVDVPTNWGTDTGLGGEVRGNYCTFNPNLYNAGSVTYSNGNLLMTMTGNADRYNLGTIAVLTGKWYWELVGSGVSSSGNFIIGICKSSRVANGPWSAYGGPDTIYFNTSDGWSVYGSNIGGGTGTITNGDVIGVALDMDSNYIYLYKNNVLYASRSGSIDLTTPHTLFVNTYNNGSSITLNAGQRPFTYTAPSGFKALCTQNLPTPTVQNGGQYFNTVLWSGDSTGTTRSISGVGFQPDFVWSKARNQTYRHTLYDVIRGAAASKYLSTASDEAEGASNYASFYGYVSAFQSDGFQVTKGTGDPNQPYAWVNESGSNYVAWNWKANGAGLSNTAGSISSTVSANTTAGFSIVTYTGNGSTGTIGHGLGVAPSMIIIKVRSTTNDWGVGHTSIGWSQAALLNLTNTFGASSYFNSTAPTSTVFSVGNSAVTNANSATYVAYCFASIAGYSAFGSYTGNGSADGPFIYTGFRPAWLMIKSSTVATSWYVYDDARNTYNFVSLNLFPNSTAVEDANSNQGYDFVSNGFKLRQPGGYGGNNSGATYVYAAFAENPFKIARAR